MITKYAKMYSKTPDCKNPTLAYAPAYSALACATFACVGRLRSIGGSLASTVAERARCSQQEGDGNEAGAAISIADRWLGA